MATVETIDQVTFKEEFVFVDEYFPIDLHEEEVVAETLETVEVVTEQRVNNEEIIHATNSILPDDADEEGYDPLDPSQWAQEEVIIESSDTFIKQEYVTSGALHSTTTPTPTSQEEEQSHVYECYKCARRFNFKDKLFKHMKLHHARGDDVMIERDGKRIWTCTQCDKTFISRKGSIIHQRTHTGERPYSCSVCQKRFIDSSTLMKHQVIHQAVRPFTCLICNRGFNQKVALQRHERTHGQLQPTFKCKYCPKTFLVASSLQAHEKIHSGIKPYTCQYCPARFHTSTAQRQHERVHTNERPYGCNYCPKAFKDSGTLFKHQVIHSGIRPFVCPICSQGFTQKVALRKHIRSHVSRNPANNCEVCETVFFSKDELCSHVEEHIEQHPSLTQVKSIATSSVRTKQAPSSPEQQEAKENGDLSDLATLCDVAISTAGGHLQHSYPCLHCGMSFRRKKSLDSHLSIHRTTCKYCDRPFPDKASLETHEKRLCSDIPPPRNVIVTNRQFPLEERYSPPSPTAVSKEIYIGKNPKRFFYCERCDKTFSSRNGYIIHQRSHTGERPYPCRWCDKAFGDSATRHKHERIHTGERPFKCSRCPRAFNQRAALRAHQVTHTVDRAFLCKYCPSSFPYFATLKRHQQACHNEIACPLCSLSTNDTKKLSSHIIAKHISLVNGSLSCALCESGMFTDTIEFCDHMVWHAKQQQTGTKMRQGSRMSRRQVLRRKALNYTTKNRRGRTQEDEDSVEIVEEQNQIEDEEEEELEQEVEQEVETDPLEEEEERIQVEVEEGEIRVVEVEGEEGGPVEQVIEQTVVTEDFPIVDEEWACDMCGVLCPDQDSLKQHVPLHF